MWTDQHTLAFQALKVALSSAPCLALPDFSIPFHIETDACATGIGAVLLQNGHPIAYISRHWVQRIGDCLHMKKNIWLF